MAALTTSARRTPRVRTLGADRRRLYTLFPATAVAAGTTSVNVFRQKSRTLDGSLQHEQALLRHVPEPRTVGIQSPVHRCSSLPCTNAISRRPRHRRQGTLTHILAAQGFVPRLCATGRRRLLLATG
jgi:hypothetical protein